MHELDPEELKRQRRWVKVFLTIALVSGAFALLQAVHLHFDPMAERHYGRLVHVRIADRDLAIPSEYFRGPIPRGQTTNLHLWVMMPDYTPYRGEISGDRAHIDAGWERHLIVNVDDVRFAHGDLDAHFERELSGIATFVVKQVADAHGLHRALVWRSTPRSPEPFIDHDLYYEKDKDGSASVFVSCDRDDPKKVALCFFHDFQRGNLLYSLTYRKSNLPRWRQIEDRIETLIESFSCVPYSNSISTKSNNGEQICPP